MKDKTMTHPCRSRAAANAPLRQQIERALADGPGTAADIATELGRDSQLTGAYLRELWYRGKLARRPFYPPERGQSKRHMLWLYALPAG
jgi:hypothetical protein